MFIFLCFWPEVCFLLEICSKDQNCLLKLKSRLIWICRIFFSLFFKFGNTLFVLIWSNNSIEIILRRNLVPNVECLIDSPSANYFFDLFSHRTFFSHLRLPRLITRVWHDILMLTLFRSRKRSDPSVVCFVLKIHVKKPT